MNRDTFEDMLNKLISYSELAGLYEFSEDDYAEWQAYYKDKILEEYDKLKKESNKHD